MADIKPAGVMSDIFGVSGAGVPARLIQGGETAAEMSKLTPGAACAADAGN
jgi:hypothetical protein